MSRPDDRWPWWVPVIFLAGLAYQSIAVAIKDTAATIRSHRRRNNP